MTHAQLKRAMRAGSLALPYPVYLWPHLDPQSLTCDGQAQHIGAEVLVRPVKLTPTALLVTLDQANGRPPLWGWIHVYTP